MPRPDSVVDFATLYQENCSACHGADGVNGPSYPLANAKYQALVDEQQLHEIVANGETGTLMPAFAISAGGSLTDPQVDAVVKGLRGAWYKPDALAGAHPPPYRVVKNADPAHGQQAYATYCASCHGAAGQATPSKAGSITDVAFLNLVSDQALRTIVIAGRPDIGQPDWRSDLPGHPHERPRSDRCGRLACQPADRRPGHGTEKKRRKRKMSDETAVTRRGWLMLSIGVLLNGAVALLIATPVVGYLLGPVRRNGGYNSWIDLGDVSQFALGQTRLASFVNPYSQPWDGATAKAACWVRRTQGQKFQIFAINCAHLGCPVRWFPQSELFMCPCHGGVYYADGSRAAGPPPRGLFEYEYKVQNGKLMINGGQMPTLATSAALRKGSSECTG